MSKIQTDALREALAAFAPKLKYLLGRHDLSEAALGRALKRRGQPVATKTINNLVNGRHSAQLGNLAEIADHFGVPLWVMLVPSLPLDMIDGESLKKLEKLMRDYVACDAEGRRHAENIASAHSGIKHK